MQVDQGNLFAYDDLGTKVTLDVSYGDFGNLLSLELKYLQYFDNLFIGEAYEEIKKVTNKEHYNVKFRMVWRPELGEFWKELVCKTSNNWYLS